MKCPNCKEAELQPLVAGILQCPKCKKIIKQQKEEELTPKGEMNFEPGEYFMKNASINSKWEICEKGIIVEKTPKRMLAVLICHTPSLPGDKYVRLSWFKNSIYLHAGMIKITEKAELENLIKVLKKFDEDFDENFNRIKKSKTKSATQVEQAIDEIDDELLKFKDNKCPKCGTKMKKSKNKKYFSCDRCGEIVVLEDGRPIFDIPTDKLPLSYSGNFPVNYYMPEIGITYRWLMAEWKAVVIIYAKENPDKKWLRFYWWQRNLQGYISSEYIMDTSTAASLAWNAKKGVSSPNVYDKNLLQPLLKALEKVNNELYG